MQETIKLGSNAQGDFLLEFHSGTSIHHFVVQAEAARELARAILAESEQIVPATVHDMKRIRPLLVPDVNKSKKSG